LDFRTSPEGLRVVGKKGRPNPLRESFRLASRALGKDLPVKLRFLRPISYDPAEGLPRGHAARPLALAAGGLAPAVVLTDLPAPEGSRPPFATEFLLTSAESRRTDRPFEERAGPTAMSPAERKKRGPIAVGVAVEVPLPASWAPRADTARLAILGQGGAFVDPTLPAAREKLLLDTCNWLLGRDDLLTAVQHDQEGREVVWSYPRVRSGEREKTLWLWATRLGLPVLFAYLGLVVLMRRRLR